MSGGGDGASDKETVNERHLVFKELQYYVSFLNKNNMYVTVYPHITLNMKPVTIIFTCVYDRMSDNALHK